MTRDDAKAVLRVALGEVAPEMDLDRADPDANLQEEFDLDSIGFLAVVEILHEQTGLALPERDYAQLASVNACLDYLTTHAG